MTMLPREILEAIFEGKPFTPPELWLAYFDAKGREIGPRDPLPLGSVTLNADRSVVFPPTSQERMGVVSVAAMDTQEGKGNIYYGTYSWPGGQGWLLNIPLGASAKTRTI